MKLKEWFAEQFFKYEFGVRVFNNFRMILMILTMVNTFLILLKINLAYVAIVYVASILFATLGIWLMGHILDKFGMWFSIDKAYFKRGKNTQELDEMLRQIIEKLEQNENGKKD